MHGCVDNGYRKWMREGRGTKPWFVLSWYLWVMSRTEVHQMLTGFQWCALLVFSPADSQHIGLQACSCTRNVWMQFQVEWLHNLDSVWSLPPIPHWRAKDIIGMSVKKEYQPWDVCQRNKHMPMHPKRHHLVTVCADLCNMHQILLHMLCDEAIGKFLAMKCIVHTRHLNPNQKKLFPRALQPHLQWGERSKDEGKQGHVQRNPGNMQTSQKEKDWCKCNTV